MMAFRFLIIAQGKVAFMSEFIYDTTDAALAAAAVKLMEYPKEFYWMINPEVQIHNEQGSAVVTTTEKDMEKSGVINYPPLGGPPPSPPFDLSWLLYLGLGLAILAVIYWAYRSGLT